jgi:N-hydroxyarylamine O-acetyltransferase
MKPVDFDAYFARIGYGGRFAPTLETLQQIHALHAAAIPFENLSAFLGEPIKLDLESLQEKLVSRERGGWCFEHNLLFRHVLRGIGFHVTPLGARVRWNVPANVITPRSHCLLRVKLDSGDYIADVGFGGQSLTAPLRLEPDVEQRTPHEEQLQPDFEVSNWYLAHHPQSQFVTGVIAARAAADCRHALRNSRYAVHYPDGRTERRALASVDEYRDVLADTMRIRLPEGTALEARLAALLNAGN